MKHHGKMPGPAPTRVTYEERPTLAPEALDNYDRSYLAERKRRYLARILLANEAKRLFNLQRTEQR